MFPSKYLLQKNMYFFYCYIKIYIYIYIKGENRDYEKILIVCGSYHFYQIIEKILFETSNWDQRPYLMSLVSFEQFVIWDVQGLFWVSSLKSNAMLGGFNSPSGGSGGGFGCSLHPVSVGLSLTQNTFGFRLINN